MIRVEASTLQEAYSKAASELSCSVVDLEISIIQNGSNGILGLFKKNAIIEVYRKGTHQEKTHKEPLAAVIKEEVKENDGANDERKDNFKRSKNRRNRHRNKSDFSKEENSEKQESISSVSKENSMPSTEAKVEHTKPLKEPRHTISTSAIDQNFHQEKRNINDILDEVRLNVKNLFKYSCFTLDVPQVSKFDE